MLSRRQRLFLGITVVLFLGSCLAGFSYFNNTAANPDEVAPAKALLSRNDPAPAGVPDNPETRISPGNPGATEAYRNSSPGGAEGGGSAQKQNNSQTVAAHRPEAKPPEQAPTGPVKQSKPLREVLREKGVAVPVTEVTIVVDKSAHTLTLYSQGTWLKSYPAAIGDGGDGDKEVAGDHRTPEGTFYICEKAVLDPPDEYLGSRWMRLSYPSIEDAARGLEQQLIDRQTYDAIIAACVGGQTPPQNTALGGGIGIHGGSKPEWGSHWTWGCIGLANSDIEDFYDYVPVGTRVVIQQQT